MSDKQSIGLLQTSSLVIGNLVGSGVFLLPAALAVYGGMSLIGTLITSIGAIFLSLIFAKLGSITNQSGGPHVYVQKAFGEVAGFYVAWGYWVLSWISNAALVVAIISYLSGLFGGFNIYGTLFAEMVVITFVTIINLAGIKNSGKFEVIFTALKLVPLIFVPFVGLFFIKIDNFSHLLSNSNYGVFESLSATIFLTIWGFIGIETGSVPAKEIKNRSFTVPCATIIGTLMAGLIYIIGIFAMLGVMGTDALSISLAPYADLTSHIFGGNWGNAMKIAAALCALGSFNGWTLVVSRIASGASESGLFPKFFAVENKNGAPKWSIIVSSALTICVTLLSLSDNLVKQFNVIIDISIALALIIYVICVFSFVKIFATTILRNVVTILVSMIFILTSLYFAGLNNIAFAIIIIMSGFPVRLLVHWQKSKSNNDLISTPINH